MASFTITGEITKIGEIKKVKEDFYVREFTVKEGSEQYPTLIPFQAIKKMAYALNHYGVGDIVVVRFNINAREYNGTHYVNLTIFKIDKMDGDTVASAMNANTGFDDEKPVSNPDYDDDLPF